MRVLNVLIDTHAGYANKPTFIIMVDELPREPEKILFEKKGDLYFGYDKDGYVDFYSHNKDNPNGYGGRTINVMMRDGEEIDLVGPWSSRAGVMNVAGFPASVDVVFQEVYTGRRMHGAILADTLSMHAELKKVETRDGEYTFEPTIS